MQTSITSLTASELALAIRTQQLSVTQVLVAFLHRIDQLNPQINAISALRPRHELLAEAAEKEAALEAGLVVGPLFGVPVTIKESIMVAGMKLTNGDPLLRHNLADSDAVLVQQLKSAGAIIIGMTNIAFFSIDWQSTNAWNGTTNNPHDLSRTAGGSSGGSAAAVAAGFSPLSMGSDSGGSIRIPAHFCGIYGLRPTENYLSNRGHLKVPGKPQGRRHVVSPGPFANSLADLALVTQVLTQPTAHTTELPPLPYDQQAGWDGRRLKIAYSEHMNGVGIDAEYLQLFRGIIKQLKNSGHEVHNDHPVYNEQEAYLMNGKLAGFENGINVPAIPLVNWLFYLFLLIKYRDHAWALGMAKGIKMSNAGYAKVIDYKDGFSEIYNNFLTQYDLWITPVCALAAFKHQAAGKPFLINGQKVPYTKALAAFAFTSAFSGHPVLVIPIGFTKNGLPVGVQLHARKYSEKRLIEMAQSIETSLQKDKNSFSKNLQTA